MDTAGRLHVDTALMDEIRRLADRIQPHEILFVADSMTGQDAVKSAEQFAEVLPLTGAILTKLDGDSRGGAALSIRTVAQVPIRFVGVGLEQRHTDLAQRRVERLGGDLALALELAEDFLELILQTVEHGEKTSLVRAGPAGDSGDRDGNTEEEGPPSRHSIYSPAMERERRSWRPWVR